MKTSITPKTLERLPFINPEAFKKTELGKEEVKFTSWLKKEIGRETHPDFISSSPPLSINPSRYSKGGQCEADESVGLVCLPLEDVRTWAIPDDLIERMTPHCKGGLRLLHILLNHND